MGCGCFQGVRRCDAHAVNRGPDTAPSAEMETVLGPGAQYEKDLMVSTIKMNGRGGAVLGHGRVRREGNLVTWDTNGIAMPPNSDFGTWPKITGPVGSTRTT
ncbi:MAG: hypothetical protein Q7R81_05375, partial [Candidatus Peregrinibacteria bacterium]|nr:hypothetical protein [Candidatus Peregrinibacteria bacterium]